MSHYVKLKPVFLVKHETELVASLKQSFGANSVCVFDLAENIGGYDSQANKKAHVIIRKADVARALEVHGWNDIGYERTKDGEYNLWADPVDFPKQAQDLIARDYNERVLTKNLEAQGYTLDREILASGHVHIKATVCA